MDEEYDVVLDTLQRKYDILVSMDSSEFTWGGPGIMTQIRDEQRDQLQKAMKLWKHRNE